MRLSVPKLSMRPPANGVSRAKRVFRPLIQIAVLAVLAFGIYIGIHKYNDKHNAANSRVVKPTSINQLESILDKGSQDNLSKGNYAAFQSTQALIANRFLAENDLADSERVMNDVLARVPKDKIIAQTYFVMVSIEAAKKDVAAQKKYLQLLISTLKADGDTQGAAAEQKILDGLK